MEVTSKYYGVKVSLDELIEFMTQAQYDDIEKKKLNKAKTEYDLPFTHIDYIEGEGSIEFGVSY